MKKILLIPLVPFIFLATLFDQFSTKTLIRIVYFGIWLLFMVILYHFVPLFGFWVFGAILSGILCLFL